MAGKVAVILCGCGLYDGSEINESVSVLLALSKYGLDVNCFSIDREQADVINHLEGKPSNEKRNLLTEAGRIARGDIRDIKKINPSEFDGVIFPGGFGAAKNFIDYAFKGREASILPEVKELIQSFYENKKYIGAVCISPMVIAKAFEGTGVKPVLTAGLGDANKDLEHFGAESRALSSTEICIDEKNKIVSAPAFMNDATLFEVYTGIEKMVKHIADNC